MAIFASCKIRSGRIMMVLRVSRFPRSPGAGLVNLLGKRALWDSSKRARRRCYRLEPGDS